MALRADQHSELTDRLLAHPRRRVSAAQWDRDRRRCLQLSRAVHLAGSPNRAEVRDDGCLSSRPTAIPRPDQRRDAAAGRRDARQRDQGLLGRRHRPEWTPSLVRAGAGLLPVRSTAVGAEPHPDRRLRPAGARADHDPNGTRALAVRAVIWTRKARPSVARTASRARVDRRQRRLPASRRPDQHADETNRLAVRAHRRCRPASGLSQHAGRARSLAHSCGAGASCSPFAAFGEAGIRSHCSRATFGAADDPRSLGGIPVAGAGAAGGRRGGGWPRPDRRRPRRDRSFDEWGLPSRSVLGAARPARIDAASVPRCCRGAARCSPGRRRGSGPSCRAERS